QHCVSRNLGHGPDGHINALFLDQVGHRKDDELILATVLPPHALADLVIGPKTVGVDEMQAAFEVGPAALLCKAIQNKLADAPDLVVALEQYAFEQACKAARPLANRQHA